MSIFTLCLGSQLKANKPTLAGDIIANIEPYRIGIVMIVHGHLQVYCLLNIVGHDVFTFYGLALSHFSGIILVLIGGFNSEVQSQ